MSKTGERIDQAFLPERKIGFMGFSKMLCVLAAVWFAGSIAFCATDVEKSDSELAAEAALWRDASGKKGPLSYPKGNGVRMVSTGHSWVAPAMGTLPKIAAAAGIEGHIITVCSVAGLYGVGNYSAYCAAKHGVTGFMRSCKWEVRKQGIKASTIFPMRVDTEFFADYAKKPEKREMLSAKDLADDIVAVASQNLMSIVKVRYTNFCKRVGAFLFSKKMCQES